MSVSPEKAPPLPRRSVANTLLQSVSSFVEAIVWETYMMHNHKNCFTAAANSSQMYTKYLIKPL